MSSRRILFVLTVAIAIVTGACTTLLGTFDVSGDALSVDAGFDAPEQKDVLTVVDAKVGPNEAAAPPDAALDSGVSCAADKLLCNGVCVDHSAEHCTGCAPCSANTPLCIVPAQGAAPFCGKDCPVTEPTVCSGRCIDTNANPDFCGSCTTPCPEVTNATRTCTDKVCGFVCLPGSHRCGDRCVSDKDVETCGTSSCTACVPPANSTSTCDGTACGSVCAVGFHDCGGVCVSNTSVDTCGASCLACPQPSGSIPACDGLSCSFTCAGGALCTDGCFDLTSDQYNCGACGKTCAKGVTCTGGACVARYGYTSAGAETTNTTFSYLFSTPAYVPRTITVTHLAGIVRGTGFNAVLALYNDVGGHPSTRLTMTAATAMNTLGNVELPVPNVTIPAGTYWVASATQSAGIWAYSANTGTSNIQPGWVWDGTMPATWTSVQTFTASINHYLVGYE